MSFSSSVKNQLCRIENEDCCSLAEISAIIGTTGTLDTKSDNALKLLTENSAMARRFFSSMKASMGISPDIKIRRNQKLKMRAHYIITIPYTFGVEELLEKLGMDITPAVGERNAEFSPNSELDVLLEKECCRRAYLRGAFLAGGSVSNPEKTYHLEINNRYKKIAAKTARLMKEYELNSKIIRRKGDYVVYLKEGDNIVDFLNIIGAHTALLELENIRIVKQVRNSVNRIVNCETANLTKTVDAAVRQLECIKQLQNNPGLDKIPPQLREIAVLRLKNPDASLKELGQMMTPPLGKSGVNHRLIKLEKLADEKKGLPPNKGDNQKSQ